MPVAVGTSLLVIVINSAAGIVSHGTGAIDHLSLALAFVVGGSIGSLTGARVSGRVNEAVLKRGFALFVATLGMVLVTVNAWQIVS